MPADLRVRNIDDTTAETLMQHGFVPVPIDPKKPDALELVSKFGEINLQMSDGARYILRFGNTTGASSAGDAKDKKADAGNSASAGMDRYLFVMADFNENAISKPAKEQLPPEEKAAPKADQKAVSGPPVAAPPKPDAKKDDAKKPDAAKDPNAAKDTAKKDQPGKSAADEQAEKAKLRKAEEERIAKENTRRKEEYSDKVTAGKKHVAELNKRFAQWYYVISDNVYQKIHLDRKAIVKKKEPPKDEHDHALQQPQAAEPPVGPAGTLKKVEEPK